MYLCYFGLDEFILFERRKLVRVSVFIVCEFWCVCVLVIEEIFKFYLFLV